MSKNHKDLDSGLGRDDTIHGDNVDVLDKYIDQISAGKSLTQFESHQATLALLSKNTSTEKIKKYLKALRTKGETTEEILGVITALQSNMVEVPTTYPTLDIVGTGGDKSNSINISTAAAILAASCDVTIAKHGNRAVSSQCGSADVLEKLGININMSAAEITHSLDTLNIAFCFAPHFHPALAQLRDIRRQINTPTVFNLVGPFLNPTRAKHYLLGVFSAELLKPFADILSALNVEKSAVVHSDGLDEITCSGITQVIEVSGHKQHAYTLDPVQLGFQLCDKNALKGGDAAYNAHILTAVLQEKSGPIADTIILNAAMGIYLYGKTKNLLDAIKLARENLLAGKAFELLQRWIEFCRGG